MVRYITGRLFFTGPVLLGVTVVVFLLLFLTPGDPARVILGPEGTPEAVAQLRHELGLDRPAYIQYGLWLSRLLRGDMGRSLTMDTPVAPLVWQRFQNTSLLTVAGLTLSTLVGVLAGVLSATHRNALIDRIVTVLSLFGLSMPVFWLGIMAIFLFSLRLRWFPVGGMYGGTGGSAGDALHHLLLPALVIATVSLGTTARFTRSSLLEVMEQEYVRTARGKGLSRSRVLWRHALRNAWIPVVTVVGLQVGYLLGGAVLTETVFAWPGLGLLMLNAILQRDLPLVQGGVLLIALVFVLVNLAVDVLYVRLDPRIRYA